MVEVEDKDSKTLRKRINSLTRELDELDHRYAQAVEAFRGALSLLTGLAPREVLGPKTQKALTRLKKAAASDPVKPNTLAQAVGALKNALMAEPISPPAKEKKTSSAGQHVAMALLSGLRMGEPEFDRRLEAHIKAISKYMANDQVRPAMVELVDLLDQFREVQEKRRQQIEGTLKEILGEVLNAEQELADTFQQTSDQLVKSSRDYDAQVTASASRLAKQISGAVDLDTLRTSVLLHVRALRENMRDRQDREKKLLAEARKELERMRATLESTRQRMEEVEKESQEYIRQALTDPMTRIANKRAFSRRLQEAMQDRRLWPVCLIVFDIDHFKNINDTYGHQAGDRALVAMANHVSKVLRSNDTLYRYAGDEFCIVLVKSSLNEAKDVAERVRNAAGTISFTYRGKNRLTVTVSLGVAQAKEGETPESLFERADKALYQAKEAGRNRVAAL